MNWSKFIRQFHRWTSIAFVIGVVTYTIDMQNGQPAAWVGMLAAGPLLLLALTGLYLFVLPYLPRSRRPASD